MERNLERYEQARAERARAIRLSPLDLLVQLFLKHTTRFSKDITKFSTHLSLVIYRSSVLEKRHVNPETSKFSSTGTCKKYRCTVYSGDASDEKIMKNMTYRVLDSGFAMHA